jgi:hypothetical protein
MHYGSVALLNTITGSISQGFFHDIITELNEAHRSACTHFESKFTQEVARDAFPIYRRAIVEDRIKEIGRRHNFSARSVPNKTRSSFHSEIEIEAQGKRLILTTLAVHKRYDMSKLRSANFRKTLAEEAQLHLFQDMLNNGDGYYGLILYGARPQKKDIDFAYLGFPAANCKEWYGHYNLHDLAIQKDDMEIIADVSEPVLKKNVIKKEQ